MVSVEIFYNDLKPEKQAELLNAVHVSDPSEMNWDINMCPIAIVDFEEMEDV